MAADAIFGDADAVMLGPGTSHTHTAHEFGEWLGVYSTESAGRSGAARYESRDACTSVLVRA